MQRSSSEASSLQPPRLPETRRGWLAANRAPSLYFIVGQVGWFACVLSAARGTPWMGAMLALVLVVLHVLYVARPFEELKLLLSVVVIGGTWDSVLVSLGLLTYPTGMMVSGLAPYWIAVLWALFAAQLNTTYGWLKSRLPLAALLGAIAGPLSFRAGAALGALRFVKPGPAALMLALGWAVLLPVAVALSNRWDGVKACSV